ncbi:hypothetical protein I5J47_gp42 [Mycobacterium phage Arib1]|uniref:Uncharacterized protein n=14 Tax=Caudoviricetes TaxID=2731619 RepID=A0A2Z5XVN8_9CAUD|nr:gp43 [Mycobacterium phage Brujita]YP_008051267.1 hypothetical protein PBI_FISHBURNE_42 [Mycobacterium phage Fishburne]YP_009004413.1 hypothetical protein PBI_DONOVAN_42 [Mycobacterium phage Donovan]YP_009013061.1 hypothetical protein CM06_gp44 [Mycobacterium phage Babsiella]YP_009125997.1 hypothetical protein MALITHI_42 [Mycobacterium phage Malithi]YP_009303802.1 hypothetical protein SEA_SHIPWRECK_44 [Mycobacterium phage Shipwreck]YP_009604825.1 hypothetical protein FDH94_gp42 [Mycobacteri
MTAPTRRPLCPVCWQPVSPTTKANIARHFDAIRADVCPGSGEPYRLTIERRPEFVGVQS